MHLYVNRTFSPLQESPRSPPPTPNIEISPLQEESEHSGRRFHAIKATQDPVGLGRRLKELPPELLINVFSHLSAQDLANVEVQDEEFSDILKSPQIEAALCKPIVQHHQNRLIKSLNFLDFENLDIITALIQYDENMGIYEASQRNYRQQGPQGTKLRQAFVSKFTDIYNNQQALLRRRWVQPGPLVWVMAAVLFGLQDLLDNKLKVAPQGYQRMFLDVSGNDLHLLSEGQIDVDDAHDMVQDIAAARPFGRMEPSFPLAASLSSRGLSSLEDREAGEEGRKTLIRLGAPEVLWDLGLGSLKYYLPDDSFAAKVHRQCKRTRGPLRLLAQACFLESLEVCRVKPQLAWA